MKKLTYNGDECNNYIYFSFNSEYFNTSKVTNELGIQPTSLMIKSEPVPKSTSWHYEIKLGAKIDFKTPLEELVSLLETKVEIINRLKKTIEIRNSITTSNRY